MANTERIAVADSFVSNRQLIRPDGRKGSPLTPSESAASDRMRVIGRMPQKPNFLVVISPAAIVGRIIIVVLDF
jgi:hypothetical protein